MPKGLDGVYYYFERMEAARDNLRPASEYKGDRDAIQAAEDLETTLTKYTFSNGRKTGETVLYAPRRH